MPASKDNLPHELKYHINPQKKNKSVKIRTPKGKKYEDSMVMPSQSPGGLNGVLNPSMVQLGFVIFSLKDIQRTSWTLNEAPGPSPLKGTVQMKITKTLVPAQGFIIVLLEVSG
ncbi:hypothetical protein DMENIID0001_009270 [Sergentomyia squamirostris]